MNKESTSFNNDASDVIFYSQSLDKSERINLSKRIKLQNEEL
jgi:hypothetical protein